MSNTQLSVEEVQQVLYTRNEIGKMLNINPKSVYNYEKEGRITPFCYVGSKPRYTLESIMKLATPHPAIAAIPATPERIEAIAMIVNNLAIEHRKEKAAQ